MTHVPVSRDMFDTIGRKDAKVSTSNSALAVIG